MSHLTNRCHFVSLGLFQSEVGPVKYGIPQSSILSPLLFSIYMFPLGQLLRSHRLNYHIYADDTQIYTHTKPYSTLAASLLSNMGVRIFTDLTIQLYYDYPVHDSIRFDSAMHHNASRLLSSVFIQKIKAVRTQFFYFICS